MISIGKHSHPAFIYISQLTRTPTSPPTWEEGQWSTSTNYEPVAQGRIKAKTTRLTVPRVLGLSCVHTHCSWDSGRPSFKTVHTLALVQLMDLGLCPWACAHGSPCCGLGACLAPPFTVLGFAFEGASHWFTSLSLSSILHLEYLAFRWVLRMWTWVSPLQWVLYQPRRFPSPYFNWGSCYLKKGWTQKFTPKYLKQESAWR